MKSTVTVATRNALLTTPIGKVVGWAAGCLLRCAADATARALQHPHVFLSGGSPLPVTPKGKS